MFIWEAVIYTLDYNPSPTNAPLFRQLHMFAGRMKQPIRLLVEETWLLV